MTKPWREVAQSDGFLALSPEEQGTARLQYFSSVVAPLVPQSERDAVLQRFLADTASLERGPADESDPLMRVASSAPSTAQPTFTASPVQSGSVLEGVEIPYDPAVGAHLSRRANAEPPTPRPVRRETFVTQGGKPEARSAVRAAADLALGTYSGAVGLAKGIADNVNAGDNPASDALAMVQAGARRLQSDDLRDQQIKREAQILNAQRNGGELAAARAAFQSLFSQPAAGLDVVAQGAGSLLPILALGAAGASPALMATVNAAANAGSGASDTAKALKALPATVWAESPSYAELVRMGASHEQAVALLAPVMATPAQLAGAVTGYISGRTGLERTIGRSPRVAGNTAGDRSMRAVSELFGEQLETAAPQMTGNVAVGALDGRTHLTEGMGQGAVDTLAGTVVGAGVAARRVAPQVQAAPRPDPVPEILSAATVDEAIGAATRALSAPLEPTTNLARSPASDLQLPEEAADVSAGTEVRSADGWAPSDGGPDATPGFSAGGERAHAAPGGVPAGDPRRAEPGDAREDDGPRGGRAAEIEAIARRITELEAQSDGTVPRLDANEEPPLDSADSLPADLAVGNPDTRVLKAADEMPSPVWTKNPSGTLSVQGDGRVIRDILNRAGVTTYIPVRGGVMVGLRQADQADSALREFAATTQTPTAVQPAAPAGADTEQMAQEDSPQQMPVREVREGSTPSFRSPPGSVPGAAAVLEKADPIQEESDAPLTISGKPKEILRFLQDNGITSAIPVKSGVKVGRSQARRARLLLTKRNAQGPALGEFLESTSRGETLTVAGPSRPLESGLAAAAVEVRGAEPGRAAGAADQQITAAQGAKATERERIAAMREATKARKEVEAAAKAERRTAEMDKARGKNPRSPAAGDEAAAANMFRRRGEVSNGETADLTGAERKAVGAGMQRDGMVKPAEDEDDTPSAAARAGSDRVRAQNAVDEQMRLEAQWTALMGEIPESVTLSKEDARTHLDRLNAAPGDNAKARAILEAAAASSAPQPSAQEGKGAPAKIEDVGEKIGGARKDLAEGTGRAGKKKTDDTRPAWARRFQVSQIARAGGQIGDVKDEGRWIIRDTKNTDWMGQPKQVGSTFASQEEADAFVPIAAVGLKHRAVPISDGKYEIWRDITDRKRVKVVDKQFDSRDDAMRYMVEHAVEIIETNTTFGEADLPLPPDRKRTGPERRQGNVKGEDFKDTFGFRGVEFGNWNNQDERQALMNDAYDGLLDLADVMGIPPKAIGLNGDLALAFGARGHGLNSARAHYELERAVINLTKEKGAGSLAHEWFHALDYYFGRQDGKASSEWVRNADGTRTLKVRDDSAAASHGFSYKSQVREEVRAAYDALLKTIFKKGTTYVEDTDKADKFVAATREELANELDRLRKELSEQKNPEYYKRNNKPASAEQLAEFDAIAKRMLEGEAVALTTDWMKIEGSKAAIASRWSNESLEQINAIYKAVRGRSGFDSQNRSGWMDKIAGYMKRYSQRLKMLADAQAGAEKVKMVPTDFAMNAKELDQGRGGDYWTSPHEMAARAFQGFVEDKIAEQGNVSRFLNYAPANGGMLTPWGVKFPFPRGDERVAINKSLQSFVDTLQTKDTDSGVAMFSKDETAPSGLTPAAFTAAIAEAFGPKVAERLESTGVVVPLQDQSSLPDHVVPFVREGDTVFGFFDPKTDRTYAVLENLTPEMVRGLVLHEVGVHYGFEQMLGREKYANVMKRITVMGKAGNKQVIAARDQAQKNASAPRQVPEETLAYLVQSNPEMRVVREVLAAIKAFLFKTFGIGGKYLTVDDMTALAKAAVLHSSRTEPGTRAPDFAKFQRVWHGSPHEFDRFDMGKVGTGEGAQAYGFGLYFAGRKEVADYYRRTLSEQAGAVGGKPINPRNPLHIAAANLYAAKGDKAAAIAELREALDNLRLYPDGAEPIYREAVRLLESGDAIPEYKPVKGKLYEVEIPDEGSYLLWDEPLSEQPKQIRDALMDDDVLARRLAGVHGFKNRGDFTGAEAYRALSRLEGNDQKASENLHKRGIAGIKYMDGASRNRPLRELKREFLKELPQDADFDEVTDLFGTGTFSPANEAILKELQANDWLGFDYPAQAVSAALGGELANFDASPALVQAVADAQQGATFNYVVFDDSTVKIEAAFSRRIGPSPAPDEAATWDVPEATKADKILYETQDGRIDLKRAQEAIRDSGRQIEERFDARLAETLYPGRVAYRNQQFLEAEVKPLLQFMALNRVGLAEIGDFLLARHAPERNAQIASVNPKMADGGAGRNSKGDLMTTEAAEEYLAALDPRRRKVFESVAARVDAITAGTRKLLVDEGLEKADVVRAWESAYKHYAPLHKDEVQAGTPHPIGTGFSVKGSASKRAIGSTKQVTNVLGHVLMQREAALTRAEKNRVGLSLYGLVLSHPNPGFWTVIRPGMSGAQIEKELSAVGVDPGEAKASMEGVPTIRGVDQATGQVVDRPNPLYKNLPGAITLKIAGEDRVVMLNVQNEHGLRLAASMKNLDGLTGFDLASSIVGQATRWIASVSTRYNPVFGLVNVIRDTQNGIVNLTSTILADKKAEILGNVPAALVGIARDLRNDAKRTEWSDLFNEFQEAGGQTGYRDIFRDAGDRTKAIEHELKQLRHAGMLTPGKAAHAVLDLLDGFNTALENAVRLSAYKTGIDSGLSRAEAARIGRELTVDFNRKGRIGREIGPLYAFANASLQGAARTIETLRGPAGAKIIAGGVALGVLQALMLAAAGYDEDDIPDFVKTRSLIIPTGWHSHAKNYIAIPYGLGMHVLPNTGRVLTELTLSGGKDLGEKVFDAVGEIASAFNPLGGGNIFTADGALKTMAPTVVDPVIELIANRNFAGGQIERKPFNEEGDNRPGAARARESTQRSATGQVYLTISKALNSLTGGNEFEAGAVSPTPERVRYITMTIGGGVMRELEKTINAAVDTAAGRPVKANALPLTGRFFGEVDRDAVEQARFFEAKNKINKLHSSLKAAEKAGDREAYRRILREHPEAEYYEALSETQRSVSALNKLAAETISNPERLKQIDAERVREMQALNEALRRREEMAPTPADRLRALTE